MNHKKFNDIISFWRDVEALSPQKIPKKAPADRREPVRDWVLEGQAPWQDKDFLLRPISAEFEWRHTIYAEVYERANFIHLLETELNKPPDVFEERKSGQSCVFAVSIDSNGKILFETFILSMAAWAFGIIKSGGLTALNQSDSYDASDCHKLELPLDLQPTDSGFSAFDFQLDALKEELAWQVGNGVQGPPISLKSFNGFVALVVRNLKLHSLVGTEFKRRVKSIQVRKSRPGKILQAVNPPQTDDFLNSFFIKDLNRIITLG